MPGLQTKEGDGRRRFDRDAHDRAGGAVDAAWHIHGDHRKAASIHRLDQTGKIAFDGPRQPCPEQGIDHDVGFGEEVSMQRLDGACP